MILLDKDGKDITASIENINKLVMTVTIIFINFIVSNKSEISQCLFIIFTVNSHQKEFTVLSLFF